MNRDPRSDDEEIYLEPNRSYVQVPISRRPNFLINEEPLSPPDAFSIPIKEMGSMVLITDKVLHEAHREALLEVVKRQLINSFTRALIVGGQRVCGPVRQEFERDASYRAWELISIVDTIPDHRKEALLAQAAEDLDRVIKEVNAVPTWKLVWRKLRHPRTPLIEKRYESV